MDIIYWPLKFAEEETDTVLFDKEYHTLHSISIVTVIFLNIIII